jgi:hypothetical protein
MSINWRGVIPAVTTPFNHDDSIDHGFYHQHIQWMQSAGCIGVVPSGSLGEGATLSIAEKISLYQTAVAALNGHGAVIPGIAALSTAAFERRSGIFLSSASPVQDMKTLGIIKWIGRLGFKGIISGRPGRRLGLNNMVGLLRTRPRWGIALIKG